MTGDVDSAIGAAILNAKTKIEDMKAISEQIPDDAPETRDSDVERPKRWRKPIDNSAPKTKTISVHLSLADIKKLRLLALSSERALRDEIADMIRERYKMMAKSILSEED